MNNRFKNLTSNKTVVVYIYQSSELTSIMGRNGNAYFKSGLTPEITYNTILKCLN